jgi:hypothetical protein
MFWCFRARHSGGASVPTLSSAPRIADLAQMQLASDLLQQFDQERLQSP